MARTAIAVTAVAPHAGAQAVTLTAADHTNGMDYLNTGSTILLAFNGDSSTKGVTPKPVADQYGRLGDYSAGQPLTLTVPAISGIVPGVGVFPVAWPPIWNQTTGKVNVDLTASTSTWLAAISFGA